MVHMPDLLMNNAFFVQVLRCHSLWHYYLCSGADESLVRSLMSNKVLLNSVFSNFSPRKRNDCATIAVIPIMLEKRSNKSLRFDSSLRDSPRHDAILLNVQVFDGLHLLCDVEKKSLYKETLHMVARHNPTNVVLVGRVVLNLRSFSVARLCTLARESHTFTSELNPYCRAGTFR